MSHLRIPVFLITAFLLACGDGDNSGGDDTDTGTDTDTDTDTDTWPEMDFPCTWKLMQGTEGLGLHGIWGSSPTDIFAVGINGAIVHYDGESWTGFVGVTDVTLWDVHGLSGTDVYAVGHYPTNIILRYDGQEWSKICEETINASEWAFNLHTIDKLSETNMIAGGGFGVFVFNSIECTEINEIDWDSYQGGGIRDIWVAENGEIYIVGDDSGIGHFDGSTWEWIEMLPTPMDCYSVWGASPVDVFVGCYEGIDCDFPDDPFENIFHYDGSDWTLISPETEALSCVYGATIWGTSATSVFVGTRDQVLYYDGTNWGLMESEDGYVGSEAIWGFSNDSVFAAGGGGVWRCTPD
jgi:hypothetical protein